MKTENIFSDFQEDLEAERRITTPVPRFGTDRADHEGNIHAFQAICGSGIPATDCRKSIRYELTRSGWTTGAIWAAPAKFI